VRERLSSFAQVTRVACSGTLRSMVGTRTRLFNAVVGLGLAAALSPACGTTVDGASAGNSSGAGGHGGASAGPGPQVASSSSSASSASGAGGAGGDMSIDAGGFDADIMDAPMQWDVIPIK
jgi:hypothetical protein